MKVGIIRKITGFFNARIRKINKFINEYGNNDKYEQELNYIIRKGSIVMYPYNFVEKYEKILVEVENDAISGLYYVDRLGKKLFFPRGKTKTEVENMYRWILIENDLNSPHKYETADFSVTGRILFDIGAAEAVFALDNVDKFEKIYIFESETEWQEPLRETFKGYGNVEIYNKFVSNVEERNSLVIDKKFEYIGEHIFFKIDVEGHEKEVLAGMKNILEKNFIKIAIATYHREGDAETFATYLKKRGFDVKYSQGYIICPTTYKHPVFGDTPSLRKALLLGEKNDI